MQEGALVRCKEGDIDRKQGAGQTGEIKGFARFSQHHPREAYVKGENFSGWFWLSSLETV